MVCVCGVGGCVRQLKAYEHCKLLVSFCNSSIISQAAEKYALKKGKDSQSSSHKRLPPGKEMSDDQQLLAIKKPKRTLHCFAKQMTINWEFWEANGFASINFLYDITILVKLGLQTKFGSLHVYIYSRLSLFRLSEVQPPRYTGHLVWYGLLAICLLHKTHPEVRPLAIPYTGRNKRIKLH